jgi:hypothetical protein
MDKILDPDSLTRKVMTVEMPKFKVERRFGLKSTLTKVITKIL